MTEPIAEVMEPRQTSRQLLSALARRIHAQHLTTGAKASLRRGSRHEVVRQAAFHLVSSHIPEYEMQSDISTRWAAIAQCIALAGTSSPSVSRDGTTLAAAGLSESRFARLLASHGDGMLDQLLLVARVLHSKDVSLGWSELGELALSDERYEERADRARLGLARDYYRALNDRPAK